MSLPAAQSREQILQGRKHEPGAQVALGLYFVAMNALKKAGTAIVGRLANKISDGEKTRLRSAPATKYEQLDEGSGRQNFEIESGTASSSWGDDEAAFMLTLCLVLPFFLRCASKRQLS